MCYDSQICDIIPGILHMIFDAAQVETNLGRYSLSVWLPTRSFNTNRRLRQSCLAAIRCQSITYCMLIFSCHAGNTNNAAQHDMMFV